MTGANGSGKTTLLKIISTLVLPSSGGIFADGINVVSSPEAAKSRIGLMCGAENSFYQMMTVEANIGFFAKLYGNVPKRRIERIFEGLGIDSFRKVKFSHLSSGMRQKLALARAMLIAPGILLVDEVSRSLDKDSSEKVSTYIKDYSLESNAACVVVTDDRLRAKEYSNRSGYSFRGQNRGAIMNILWAFIFRDTAIERTYRFHLVLKLIGLVTQLIIFFFISRFLGNHGYFKFVFIGLVFSGFFQFWLNVFAENIRQEQYWGTIEHVFLVPQQAIVCASFFYSV